MTFEEQFPSLKEYEPNLKGMIELTNDMQKFCLDKQKVREFIVKIQKLSDRYEECDCAGFIHHLEKDIEELGL
jgi:hypothetical protein